MAQNEISQFNAQSVYKEWKYKTMIIKEKEKFF